MDEQNATKQSIPVKSLPDAIKELNSVRVSIMTAVQNGKQSPTEQTIARQAIDHLDAGALFTQQLMGFQAMLDKEIEEKVQTAVDNGQTEGVVGTIGGGEIK